MCAPEDSVLYLAILATEETELVSKGSHAMQQG